jgi:poly-gamma-glutamate capsule biosynthesis protein CapA/YwtB (metallophosphatase superfamily)
MAAASVIAKSQEPDARTIALLGQALIRHDLRRESPASFERMRELLNGTPVVFTNFEAAVQTSLDVRATHSGLVHNAEPDALDSLREMGVNLLALSSNHAADLGPKGITATIREAEQRGMVTAGTGPDISAAARPGVLRTRHGTIAMVGFVSSGLLDDSAIAGPNRPGVFELRARSDRTWEPSDRERVLEAVGSAAGKADWVLAYHHNHEYDEKIRQQVPDNQKQIARLCVDAGATFYVAHGYPGIRAVEIYKGHPLFHGLGNFVFQTRRVVYYASDISAWQGVVVKFQLGKSVSTEIRVYPVSLRENQRPQEGQGVLFPAGAPRPAVGEEAQVILGTFGRLCEEIGTHVTIRDTHAVVTA